MLAVNKLCISREDARNNLDQKNVLTLIQLVLNLVSVPIHAPPILKTKTELLVHHVTADSKSTKNSLLKVGSKITEWKIISILGTQQDKCVACSYIENDDGTISGNRNCQRDPPLSLEVDCPIYQSSGCYSASSVHEIVSSFIKTHQQ